MINKMNFFLKQRLWFFIALFFIIVNAILVSGMFLHKRSNHREKDKRERGEHSKHEEHKDKHEHSRNLRYLTEVIIDSLGFTSEQQAKLEKINEEMDVKKDSLSEETEKCKELFAEELYAGSPDKKRLDSLIKCISYDAEKYNQLRIDNMDKIRSSCTPEQKKKLPLILKEFSAQQDHGRRRHH
jgi:Spy/CpxP family protein refolding chaperone